MRSTSVPTSYSVSTSHALLARSGGIVMLSIALAVAASSAFGATAQAADTPAPAASAPAASPAPSPVPEPSGSAPAAPASATATPGAIPPGGSSTWSSDDGKAPSQAWFDAYQKAVTTPANGQNVLLPWESPSGQVQVGQGTAVTGGWAVVDANGNAGAGISCGSVCGSGWFPTGFGSDGRPTSWVRVVQQTSAVDGNAWTGPGHYSPETGWTVPGPSGTHQWDWQANEIGPCVANCAASPSPVPSQAPADPTDADAPVIAASSGSLRPGSLRPSLVQAGVTTVTSQALAVAAQATTALRQASGGYRVVADSPALRAGQRVTVLLHRQGRPVATWSVAVRQAGTVAARLPASARGTVIMLAGGTVIGVAQLSDPASRRAP